MLTWTILQLIWTYTVWIWPFILNLQRLLILGNIAETKATPENTHTHCVSLSLSLSLPPFVFLAFSHTSVTNATLLLFSNSGIRGRFRKLVCTQCQALEVESALRIQLKVSLNLLWDQIPLGDFNIMCVDDWNKDHRYNHFVPGGVTFHAKLGA